MAGRRNFSTHDRDQQEQRAFVRQVLIHQGYLPTLERLHRTGIGV